MLTTIIYLICVIGVIIVMDDLFGFNHFKSQKEIDREEWYDNIINTPFKCDNCGKDIFSKSMYYDEMTQELFCTEDCSFRRCEKMAMMGRPYGEPFQIPREEVITLALEGLLKQQEGNKC